MFVCYCGNFRDIGNIERRITDDLRVEKFCLVGTSLFGQLVTRGTPTYAATDDVTLILELLYD